MTSESQWPRLSSRVVRCMLQELSMLPVHEHHDSRPQHAISKWGNEPLVISCVKLKA